MEKYMRVKVLGTGSFGTAWLVKCVKTEEQLVAKEIPLMRMKEKDQHQALNEVKILAKLKHKNIIRYRDAYISPESTLGIVMEYADDGEYFICL